MNEFSSNHTGRSWLYCHLKCLNYHHCLAESIKQNKALIHFIYSYTLVNSIWKSFLSLLLSI